MAQGHVIEAGKGLDTDPIQLADAEFPLRVGALTAGHKGVGHQHRAAAGPGGQIPPDGFQGHSGNTLVAEAPAGLNFCFRPLLKLDPQLLAQQRPMQAGFEVGQRIDRHHLAAILGLHQHRLPQAPHFTTDRHPQGGQQRVVDRNPHVGVVVTGDGDHGDVGTAQAGEGGGEQLDRFGGGNGAVVEVAGDHHQIHVLLLGQLHNPIEGFCLLIQQGRAMETAAKVPIGGVEQPHQR